MIKDMPPYLIGKHTELDEDHFVEWPKYKGDAEAGASGGILWHRKPDSPDGWCCGSFWFRAPTFLHSPKLSLWTLEKREPLTLSPSFRCHCGHHGFIREGKWVEA